MPTVHTIDLGFQGQPAAIAAFAVEDAAGVTLVECGPHSTHDNLIAGLKAVGIGAKDVHTLLLTHIHFDHAGSAWWWARQGTRVYVHPLGLKHMIDPTKLYASAARIYGEENMEELWGKMDRIDPYDIGSVSDRSRLSFGGNTWVAHHTPGHASHHIAWQLDKMVFTGDVGGVMIGGGPVVPPCPPPDINVSRWNDSLDRLRSLRAKTFFLTHYGEVEGGTPHLEALRTRLNAYVEFVATQLKSGKEEEEVVPLFTDFVEQELRDAGAKEDTIASYRLANPPFMSVAGIGRWLKYSGRL